MIGTGHRNIGIKMINVHILLRFLYITKQMIKFDIDQYYVDFVLIYTKMSEP